MMPDEPIVSREAVLAHLQTILADRRFVDVRVEIFGKHGSRTWAKMGEYAIERKLLTAAPK